MSLALQDLPARAGAVARPIKPLRGSLGVLGGASLAALLCGLFVHVNGYVWLVGLLTAMVVGVAWPAVVRAGVRGRVEFPAGRGREGSPLVVNVTVENRLFLPVFGVRLAGEGIWETVGAGGGGGWPATFAARRTTRLTLRLEPTRFGVVGGPVNLVCDFPFGLWAACRPMEVAGGAAGGAVVWPATHAVGPVPETDGAGTGGESGRRVGVGGETAGLRDFQRGDRLRMVHWGQSARFDRLIVRETLAETTPVVKVGLITDQSAYRTPAEFDDAVRQAASYAEGWSRAGARVCVEIGPTSGRPGGLRVDVPPNATARDALDALSRLTFADPIPGARLREAVDVTVTGGWS